MIEKIKFEKNIMRIFLISIMFLLAFMVMQAYAKVECDPVCYLNSDCRDNNPFINETCINPGECNASCKYIVPDGVGINQTSIKRDIMINDGKIKLNEKINKMVDENNRTSLVGVLNVDKGLTKHHFLFVINDPDKILIKNIDQIHFNVEPFKITEESIIFLLEKEKSVYAITYYIEPEASEEIMESTNLENVGLTEEAIIRKPSTKEKLYGLMQAKGSFFPDRLLRMIQVLGLVATIGFGLIIVYYYVRKKKDSLVDIKLLE